MQEGSPSRTARRVAMRRAEHQVLDRPLVLDDPIALRILDDEEAAHCSSPGKGDNLFNRSMRAFMVARSRFAEDHLAHAVGHGVRQYVLLGAGLDTFAYRNPHDAADLRIFEVDHPNTQAWKRERLRRSGIPVPATVTFVPVDFERQTMDGQLGQYGFHLREPAYFSWLGVTPYLRAETTLATLQLIRALCPQNGVSFDYAVPRASLGFLQRQVFDTLAARVARAGEPFLGFFDPPALHGRLAAMGYATIEDLDGEAINGRYFRDREDGLRVSGTLGRLMYASGLPAE